MSTPYAADQPSRMAIDAMPGVIAVEFGTDWCGYCRAGSPHIAAALSGMAAITHIKVEDGSGRPLGRSFRIKLWPTVVFVREGRELARVVRPDDAGAVRTALAQAAGA